MAEADLDAVAQKHRQAARDSRRAELSALTKLRARLRLLYHGSSPSALRFQYAGLTIDLLAIAFFLAAPLLRDLPSYLWLDLLVALVLAADLFARALASRNMSRWLRQPTVWVDMFVVATLLLPDLLGNFAFLRVMRLWTLSRSSRLWRPLQRRGFEPYEDAGKAVINLFTFLFVVTGLVFTFFARPGSGMEGYVDALYFTVTTVTTTGFGDITLPGTAGKLTSIVVMIIGISLFVRLASAIFRPHKVFFPCPECGLRRHDPDAVHCKACGHILNIPDEGVS